MAHKIDMTTGQAAFVSYQQTAWHGLGEVFQTELTAQQALQAARLNFIVHKSPNIHRLPDGTDIISTESFFTYRDDTMGILGTKLGHNTPLYKTLMPLTLWMIFLHKVMLSLNQQEP